MLGQPLEKNREYHQIVTCISTVLSLRGVQCISELTPELGPEEPSASRTWKNRYLAEMCGALGQHPTPVERDCGGAQSGRAGVSQARGRRAQPA